MSQSTQPLPHTDWNFDKVPDSELVACCYWEYARESKFIRDTIQRCKEVDSHFRGKFDEDDTAELEAWLAKQDSLDTDLRKIQNIGYPSETFLGGAFFLPERLSQSDAPDKPNYRHPSYHLTGSFPAPWLSLSTEERKQRAHIRNDIEQCHLAPVRLAHWSWAKEIARYCQSEVDQQDQRQKAWERAYLRREPKGNFYTLPDAPEPPSFGPIRPSLSWGVMECLLVEISWEQFTNDEIATYFRRWIKHARPKIVPEPDRRGQKQISWRVALERLAIMRLLHRFPLAVLPNGCANAWKRYNSSNRRWMRDAEKARDFFRKLFPCVPPKELPLSWPPQRDAKRPA